MCVYSWVRTRRSQSSVLPMRLSPLGGVAVISIVSRGTGVAHPFGRSFWSTRITCTRAAGLPSAGSNWSRTSSAIAATRRASAASP